jgi:hypothetical protein
MHYLGQWGERAQETHGLLNGIEQSKAFAPMKFIMQRAIRISGQ